tara:strand:+ start:653 stop:1813 length:1161 start_codon:yes stop_codon:yes gene_type:complete
MAVDSLVNMQQMFGSPTLDPYGITQRLQTGLGQQRAQISNNIAQYKSDKNQKLGLMLYALGGALKGDQDFVVKTLELQQMQEGKKKEQEKKNKYDKLVRRLKTERPDIAQIAEFYGPENMDELGQFLVTDPQKGLTAGIKDYAYYKSLPDEEKRGFLIASGRASQDPDLLAEQRKARSAGGLDPTPGQKKLDEVFATNLAKWRGGEQRQTETNINNLDNKIARLTTGQENVSGINIGLTPEPLRPIIFPEATGFLDEVSDIVYQSLRATLGAQFTEQEGKRLIAATFNQNLPEELNLPRLQRLSAKIKSIYQDKQNEADYFDRFGTLQAYKSEPSSFADILDAVYFDEYKALTKDEILDRYKSATTAEERQTILRFAQQLEKEQEE